MMLLLLTAFVGPFASAQPAQTAEPAFRVVKYVPVYQVVREDREGETRKISNIEFPVFLASGKNGKIADKINKLLFWTELGMSPPSAPELSGGESPLVRYDEDQFSYDIVRNDAKVVSVIIYSHGCRASCGGNSRAYNFDAETGRHIHASTLFTERGLQEISRRLASKWAKEIEQEYDGGDIQQCIDQMKTNYDKGTPYLGYDYRVETRGITFTRGGCWKMDGPYSANFNSREMASWLNAYGKYLYSMGPAAAQPLNPYGQFLQGNIGGKYPIRMMLVEPYPSIGYLSGFYFYEKYKEPIALFASYKDGHLEIIEYEDGNQTQKKIDAERRQDRFEGYWTDGQKKLSFTATIGEP